MHYQDISTDTNSLYRINKSGTVIFFAKNRSGKITLSIEHEQARVEAFFVFEGKGEESYTLETFQNHLVPNANSHVTIKSVLYDTSKITYTGNILIAKNADSTDASLENRNLLVGEKSSAFSKPELEILANDVKCRHASTTAPINPEIVAYLRTRGLSRQQATSLLIEGFLRDVEEKIEKLKA